MMIVNFAGVEFPIPRKRCHNTALCQKVPSVEWWWLSSVIVTGLKDGSVLTAGILHLVFLARPAGSVKVA
jgi:hypothetical protein